ncbi:UDP-3-O-[3-hydroxymyristoyl] N-acetylglucosamine deacetylase [Nitrospirillum amazonense]|uniref:UDP-3-O-acyl-N-acetylglucosamine deacetylase n=1 Tax=Nitrospirillum amazonense TaxID=28077 RepID=A0A560FHY7_9PROT|nr:UDP-3-O-acyl-N-acetylglucosamine deacetylase [Nitrospirillum amazonense]TWB21220.1 UDP-3-O-[3-hydroxymyristoyl] N-acetylglucosamine deacetylase [Nitrospirillum amazonense]
MYADREPITAARQQTLKAPINCTGVGLHSGLPVAMTMRPAPVNTGIVFRRVDLLRGGASEAQAAVPARWDAVVDTRLCTVVANATGATVGTVEHVMSALRGCGIDNLIIDLDGAEVPIMDGSAAPFVFLIECAGITQQEAARRVIRVLRPVSVVEGEKVATLTPASGSSFAFEIDFASAAVRRQEGFVRLGADSFKDEVAEARTFGFLQEVDMLRRAGLARGGSMDNAIVIDGDRVLNEGGLRFDDEFVRHKILDAVGDLYMAGYAIVGHYSGIRSGHALNNKLLHALFADASAYEIVEEIDAAFVPAWEQPLLAATA